MARSAKRVVLIGQKESEKFREFQRMFAGDCANKMNDIRICSAVASERKKKVYDV